MVDRVSGISSTPPNYPQGESPSTQLANACKTCVNFLQNPDTATEDEFANAILKINELTRGAAR